MSNIYHIFVDSECHLFYFGERNTIFVDYITLYVHTKDKTITKKYDICYDDKPDSPRDDINRKTVMDMFMDSSEHKYAELDLNVKSVERDWKWKTEGKLFEEVLEIIEQYLKNKCVIFYTYDICIFQRILSNEGINGALSDNYVLDIPCVEIDPNKEINEAMFEYHTVNDKELYMFLVYTNDTIEYMNIEQFSEFV